MFQHIKLDGPGNVAALRQKPVEGKGCLVPAFRGGVGHFKKTLFGEGLLQGNGRWRLLAFQFVELAREALKAGVLVVIAPEEKAGVAGLVVAPVKIDKGLVGQVGDIFRIAAGIKAVKVVREHGLLALLRKNGIRR